MRPKTVAIIQARMAASRLPGKVLLEIEGRPMLGWVVERTRLAHTIDQVVVATTDNPADDPVEAYCNGHDYACYRGSQYDVLDRYYQAARLFEAGIIVRITADCPLIDPGVIDATVMAFLGDSSHASDHPSSVGSLPSAVGGRLGSFQMSSNFAFASLSATLCHTLPLEIFSSSPIAISVG